MSEYSSKQVLEGARIIRGCLADLLRENASAVDEALSVILVQKQDNHSKDLANQVVTLLEQHRETRQWLHTFLRLAGDPTKIYKNYQSTAGDPDSSLSAKYTCPRCRHVWYQFSVGETIPTCEKCNLPFEPVLEEYGCPEGDYTWYIFAKATPIPQCPTHRKPLISKRRHLC